jgi:PAS domain S-box-containing protein
LTDTEGTVTGLVGIGRDITERRERERELEVAETIFQNTQDAIFLVDVTDQQEFRIQRVNEAYEEVTGLSNDDIRGATPRDVVGEETGSDIEARYRECIARGETIEYPEAIPVDGEDRRWQTKLAPVVEDGTVSKLIGAMRDVTSRDRSA